MASLNEMDIVSDSAARSLGYVSFKSENVVKTLGCACIPLCSSSSSKILHHTDGLTCCDAPVDRDLFLRNIYSTADTDHC